jgi:chitooligosaccharide deacetylase
LAQFLGDQDIPATFFVVGKYASNFPSIMPLVRGFGHLIANHTYDHVQLTNCFNRGGDVVAQVSRTDALICTSTDSPTVYLRPPYGDWTPQVALALNANLTTSLSHVGPIHWDIDASDWRFWRDGGVPSDCAAAYLSAIEAKGRGIVLMHDCTADQDVIRVRNRTFELIQLLVPELRKRGYRFARLDQVPEVAAATSTSQRFTLKGVNGLYVSPQQGGGGAIFIDSRVAGPWESIFVEDLHVGKVALRAASGHYFSARDGVSSDVLANSADVGPRETFDLISLGSNRIAFRTGSGLFLNCDGHILNARSAPLMMHESNIFIFEQCGSLPSSSERA